METLQPSSTQTISRRPVRGHRPLKPTNSQLRRAQLMNLPVENVMNINASRPIPETETQTERERETDAETKALLRAILGKLEMQNMSISSLQRATDGMATNTKQLVKAGKEARAGTTNQRPIWRVPIKEIPSHLLNKIIDGYMDTLTKGIAAPFTMAGYVGWHFVIMPIPITVRDTGGIFYKYYCYFFTIVTIFGVRYILAEYAEDSTAQTILKGLNYASDYVLMVTKPLIKWIITYLQFGINKMQHAVNREQLQQKIANGIKEGSSLARYAYCDKTPWYLKRFAGCS